MCSKVKKFKYFRGFWRGAEQYGGKDKNKFYWFRKNNYFAFLYNTAKY